MIKGSDRSDMLRSIFHIPSSVLWTMEYGLLELEDNRNGRLKDLNIRKK